MSALLFSEQNPVIEIDSLILEMSGGHFGLQVDVSLVCNLIKNLRWQNEYCARYDV